MKIPALFGLLLALAACSLAPPIVSTATDGRLSAPVTGLVYNLPRPLIRVQTDGKGTRIVGEELVPDSGARFVLSSQHRILSNDDFDFSVSKGLLGNVTANSTDQLPQVIQSVAGAVSSGLSGEFRVQVADTAVPGSFDFAFDPFEGKSQAIMGHTIEVEAPDDPSLFSRVRQLTRDRQSCVGASVCVPLMTTLKVTVTGPGGAKVSSTLPVPDPTRSMGIRLNRSACGQVANGLQIENGLLTKYDVTHPSEVADCLSIPLDIIATIISAPIDSITGRTARLQAEKDLIAAKILLAQKQAELLALQQGADPD